MTIICYLWLMLPVVEFVLHTVCRCLVLVMSLTPHRSSPCLSLEGGKFGQLAASVTSQILLHQGFRWPVRGVTAENALANETTHMKGKCIFIKAGCFHVSWAFIEEEARAVAKRSVLPWQHGPALQCNFHLTNVHLNKSNSTISRGKYNGYVSVVA